MKIRTHPERGAILTGVLLIEAAERLRDLAVQGGRMILSGFMRQEEEAVRTAYSGLTVADRSEEDEWVCLGLQRP